MAAETLVSYLRPILISLMPLLVLLALYASRYNSSCSGTARGIKGWLMQIDESTVTIPNLIYPEFGRMNFKKIQFTLKKKLKKILLEEERNLLRGVFIIVLCTCTPVT